MNSIKKLCPIGMSYLLASILLIGAFGSQAQSKSRSAKERKTNVILASVKSHIGTPYVYGGTSRKGMDCSGLLYVSFNTGGISLPRTAKSQSTFGKNLSWKKLRPGDLVFFKFKQKGEKWWHSGVITVVEKNKIRFIHASSSRGVVESNLLSDYYKKNVKGFRRVI
ncbi:MAG: C40 family peptidase [Cytophagales bacterium]|nr:C40 family peptidase [Cytophagales bacterium]